MLTIQQIAMEAESDMAAHGRGLDDYLSANPGQANGATEAYLEALCSQIRLRMTRDLIVRKMELELN